MNITEFFQHSSGKWFSQRTSHDLTSQKSESGRSDVYIEVLDKAAPEVVKLCELYGIDPALALLGVKVTWNGSLEWDSKKQTGSTVLVPVAESEQATEGKLLSDRGNNEKPVAGRYVMGSDDALTLTTDYDAMVAEERLWFAGPNLRLRTSTLKQADGFSAASFFTEIRMGVVAPQAQAAPAAEGAN